MEDRKRFLQNISRRRYLAMLAYLPQISREKVKEYTALILTLGAFTIFAVFAINPTLATIIELKKEISDSDFALKSLKNKLTSLNALTAQYQTLQADIPILMDALPQTPTPSTLLGQVQELAKAKGVKVVSLSSSEVLLYPPIKPSGKENSFVFSVTAEGSYVTLMDFLNSLTTFNRIITFESVSYTKSEKETILPKLSVRGRAYFMP